MRESRLIFVNRFYWPDEPATGQLLTDLAEAMAAVGRKVVVITSPPRGSKLAGVEHRNGVEIQRVRGTQFGNKSFLKHGCDFATFALAALARLASTVRRGDTVVIMTDPPLLSVPATMIVRSRGARLIHYLQDIFPEAASLLTGKKVFDFLRPLRDAAWRQADGLVLLSDDMAMVPRDRGFPEGMLHSVPNWAPAGIESVPPSEAERLRAEWKLTGKFVVLYFGNLGRVHDLEPVLDIADRLQGDAGIEFVFIGPGPQRPFLEAEARRRALPNVRFFPAQPRERRTEILALGDLHLVTLREGGERIVFPSKLYGICAAARPVLFIGPPQSEIAQVVRREPLGLAFSRHEIARLAAAIQELRGAPERRAQFSRAGRAFYEREASIQHAASLWQGILAKIER